MFDHIVLRRAVGGQKISAGQIAEALLFYQKVHLVIDRSTLNGLVKQIGMPQLLTLLRRPDFTAVYCEEFLGTHTNKVGAHQIHNFVAMTLAGDPVAGQLKTVEDRVRFDLRSTGMSSNVAKRSASAFLSAVPVRRFSGNHFIEGGVTAAAKRDTLDLEFSRAAIRRSLEVMPGGYSIGDELRFDVIDSELGLNVFTNINFNKINQKRSALSPAQEPITVAGLLSGLMEARADLALASFYGGDFVTSSFNSSIIQVKYSELLRRSEINFDSLKQFTEIVLPDMKTVAEVIDSGERSFTEFLLVLDRGARFKSWAKGVNPDEGLIRSYIQGITSEGWIQRMPQKTMRYAFTLALDASNPAAGFLAGLIDNFLLEKLFSGWKPNHFIDNRLKPFMKLA